MVLLPCLLLLAASQAPTAPAGGKTPSATKPPALPAAPPVPEGPAPAASEADKTDVSPENEPKANPLHGLGRTPEEQQQLDEMGRAMDTYEAEAAEFRHDVQLLVQKKYEEKRSALGASYEKAIEDLEVL